MSTGDFSEDATNEADAAEALAKTNPELEAAAAAALDGLDHRGLPHLQTVAAHAGEIRQSVVIMLEIPLQPDGQYNPHGNVSFALSHPGNGLAAERMSLVLSKVVELNNALQRASQLQFELGLGAVAEVAP